MCHRARALRPHFVFVGLGLLAGAPLARQDFVERAAELGLVHEVVSGMDRVGEGNVLDWMQTGIAVGDIDGEGSLDVVVCGGLLPTRLLLRQGAGFVDATAAARIQTAEYGRAPALGDYDRDGDLDLFVGSSEPGEGALAPTGRLFRNEGNAQFVDVTALSRGFGRGHTIYAKWIDLDADGLLDLHLCEFHGTSNPWYLNMGDGSFFEVGSILGPHDAGSTHVASFLDVEDDGWFDVQLGSDFTVNEFSGVQTSEPDRIYRGFGLGGFVDVGLGSGFEQYEETMGMGVGDVDCDGRLDIYKTEVGPNFLLMNKGWPDEQPWVDQAQNLGVLSDRVPDPATPGELGIAVGWSSIFFDIDLDPWLDLYVVNGQVPGKPISFAFTGRQQDNHLYRSLGPDAGWQFVEEAASWGLAGGIDDRGGIVTDLDSDGDLDLFVLPTVGPLRYYENRVDAGANGYLAARAQTGTSAPGGVGTRLEWVDSEGYPDVRVIGVDAQTASHSELLAHWGLGTESAVDLTVRFQSGITTTLSDLLPNQTLDVVEPALFELSARTLPAAPFATAGDPSSLVVRAFAHDAQGQPLDANALVEIEAAGLVPLSPVTHVSGNEFQREFALALQPGPSPIVLRFDGWEPRVQPRVWFSGFVSASESVLSVEPSGVRAGSADVFELVVVPRSTFGLLLGSGLDLGARMTGEASFQPMVDHGDGRYSLEFVAPATPGTHTLDLSYLGLPLVGVAQIEAAGDPDPASSLFYEEFPNEFNSAAPHQWKLAFSVRDDAGRNLGPYANVVLQMIPGVGQPQLNVRGDLYPRGQNRGRYTFVVEKDPADVGQSVTGLLRLVADGQVLASWPYVF